MPTDFGFDCTDAICQDARMWCFPAGTRLYSCTAASGMGTQDAGIFGCLPRASISGARRFPVISNVIRVWRIRCGRLDGDWLSFGSARCGKGQTPHLKIFRNGLGAALRDWKYFRKQLKSAPKQSELSRQFDEPSKVELHCLLAGTEPLASPRRSSCPEKSVAVLLRGRTGSGVELFPGG